jgi:hypothetical protein
MEPAGAHTRRPEGHPSTTVTQADQGRHYTLQMGGSFIVELVRPNLRWTMPSSSNQAVLKRTGGSSGTSARATFIAASRGNADVSAMGRPICTTSGACPQFILAFQVRVSVSS